MYGRWRVALATHCLNVMGIGLTNARGSNVVGILIDCRLHGFKNLISVEEIALCSEIRNRGEGILSGRPVTAATFWASSTALKVTHGCAPEERKLQALDCR